MHFFFFWFVYFLAIYFLPFLLHESDEIFPFGSDFMLSLNQCYLWNSDVGPLWKFWVVKSFQPGS